MSFPRRIFLRNIGNTSAFHFGSLVDTRQSILSRLSYRTFTVTVTLNFFRFLVFLFQTRFGARTQVISRLFHGFRARFYPTTRTTLFTVLFKVIPRIDVNYSQSSPPRLNHRIRLILLILLILFIRLTPHGVTGI